MQTDSITVDGKAVEISGEGTRAGRKGGAEAGGPGPALMPRQAARGRSRVGLAGARGGRGGRGRGGLGFAASARPAPSSVADSKQEAGDAKMESADTAADTKSQDDFRAMLQK